MKVYKVKPLSKILTTIIFLIAITLPIVSLVLWYNETLLIHRVFAIILVTFGISGIVTFNKIEVIVDDDKIEVHIPLRKNKTLFWNEIGELISGYFLYPESGGVSLIPKRDLGKKVIHISIWGMSLDLLKDILSHLSPDTKVYLYPYLKRKLEGKQTWFYIK